MLKQVRHDNYLCVVVFSLLITHISQLSTLTTHASPLFNFSPATQHFTTKFVYLTGNHTDYMTEEAILQGCLKHQAAAQKALYERYSVKMLAVCYRYAHNREDAEDMLQEGFIKVFSQIHTFKAQGAFEGWVRRIMVHTCINILKKNKKFNESVDLAHASGLQVREDAIPSIMQAKQVVECIRLLPIGYRTVLNLYAVEGFSHREIGVMLDIEESTSRSQYTRAKAMLEDILIKKNIVPKPKTAYLMVASGGK